MVKFLCELQPRTTRKRVSSEIEMRSNVSRMKIQWVEKSKCRYSFSYCTTFLFLLCFHTRLIVCLHFGVVCNIIRMLLSCESQRYPPTRQFQRTYSVLGFCELRAAALPPTAGVSPLHMGAALSGSVCLAGEASGGALDRSRSA